MRQLKNWTIGLTAFALTAAGALADWYRAADLATTGGAKEVAAHFQNVRAVQLQWVDGDVDIFGFLVRSGAKTEEYRVERKLDRGETIDFELDGRDITGFRVIDRGNGRYRINVLTEGEQYYYEHHHHHHHPHLPPPDGRHDDPPPARHDVRHDDHVAPPHGDHPDGDRFDPRQPPPEVKTGAPAKMPEVKGPEKKAPVKKTPAKAPAKAPARRAPAKGR